VRSDGSSHLISASGVWEEVKKEIAGGAVEEQKNSKAEQADHEMRMGGAWEEDERTMSGGSADPWRTPGGPLEVLQLPSSVSRVGEEREEEHAVEKFR